MFQKSPSFVMKSGRTSWPPQNIYSSRTLGSERSPTKSPRVGQQYKREKLVPPRQNVEKPSATKIHAIQDRMFALEHSVFCAVTVGKRSGLDPHYLFTRGFTPVKDIMRVAHVASLPGQTQPSVSIKEFIVGQGGAHAANVGSPLTKNLSSCIPGGVIMEKRVTCAMNVHNLVAVDPSLLENRRLTLENSIMSARNAGRSLDENFALLCI